MSKEGNRGYLIPLRVVTRAAKEGVTIQQLQSMVAKSARITHSEGNRRYHQYLFQVEGNRLIDFHLFKEEDPEEEVFHKCEVCKDTGKIVVFDACEHCDGAGCKHCDTGLVKNMIDCPECRAKPRLEILRKPRKHYHQR